jgi:hypothetical protein
MRHLAAGQIPQRLPEMHDGVFVTTLQLQFRLRAGIFVCETGVAWHASILADDHPRHGWCFCV